MRRTQAHLFSPFSYRNIIRLYLLLIQGVILEALCPHGWTECPVSGTCIKLFSDLKTWYTARDACKNEAGDLVKIISEEMNTFIHGLMGNEMGPKFWIGLNDRKGKGVYKWLDENYRPAWLAWDEKLSNRSERDSKCGQMDHPRRGRSWWLDTCSNLVRFVCERATVTCPKGWLEKKESFTCINLSDDSLPWYDAKNSCRQAGGHLMRVESEALKSFLWDQIPGLDNETVVWNGLSSRRFWLEEEDTDWIALSAETTNGSDIFAEVRANKTYVAGHACTEMEQGSLKQFRDGNCGDRHRYICENIPASCPIGWYRNNHTETCVRVYDDLKTWHGARTQCQAQGGDLVKVGDARAFYLLKRHLPGDLKAEYWIGLHDTRREGSFQWLDETKEIQYTFWDRYHLNQAHLDCVFITFPTAQWQVRDCRLKARFFCERSPVSPRRPKLTVDFHNKSSKGVYVGQDLAISCSGYAGGDSSLFWAVKLSGEDKPLLWASGKDGRIRGHLPEGYFMLHVPDKADRTGIFVQSTLIMSVRNEHLEATVACYTEDVSNRGELRPDRDILADCTLPLRVTSSCGQRQSPAEENLMILEDPRTSMIALLKFLLVGTTGGLAVTAFMMFCYSYYRKSPWKTRFKQKVDRNDPALRASDEFTFDHHSSGVDLY